MHRYVLSLGSNLGSRIRHLARAVRALALRGEIVSVSSVYETSPVGMQGEHPRFLNCALVYRTYLGPRAMLALAKRIEAVAGRDPDARLQSRPLDIDIVNWSGGEWQDERLVIPHPRAGARLFVVNPVNEIAPGSFPGVVDKTQELRLFCGPEILMPANGV